MTQAAAAAEMPPSVAMDRGTKLIVAGLAVVAFLIHLRIAPGYGWFRDELYFFACADHLDWGYVDHPAGVVLLAAMVRSWLGGSLLAMHAVSALSQVSAVVATAVLARELGCGRWATLVACLAVLIAPAYLSLGALLSTNIFETALWTLMLAVVVRILRGGSERLWLLFGALGGIALEFKPTMLALAFCLVVALLLTGHIGYFRRPWIWLGGAVSLLLWSPYLLWEWRHGWITLEVVSHANAAIRTAVGPLEFSFIQALQMNPVTLPLWVGGMLWLLFARDARPWRVFGLSFFIFYALMFALHAKSYYLAPAYPVLLCAGTLAQQQRLLTKPPEHRRKPIITIALYVVCGVLIAPFVLPVLSPAATVRYAAPVSESVPQAPAAPRGALWPPLAEYTGWPDLAARVADAWQSLTPEEQKRAAIFASNYGQAGALDFYAAQRGLPRAVSAHNSFYLWGPEGTAAHAHVLIVVGDSRARIARECTSVTTAATYDNPYGRPFDNGPILVCRGLKRPLVEMWPELKVWGQD